MTNVNKATNDRGAKIVSAYGSWQSPISTELMAKKSADFSYPRFFENNLFWTEFRPAESARTLVARRLDDGSIQTLTPDSYSVQTGAHEYGGLCYTVGDGNLFFVNAKDQRIYRQALLEPSNIVVLSPSQEKTPNQQAYRFADLIFDCDRNRIVAVAEIHDPKNDESAHTEPTSQLVSLNPDSGEIQILTSGADFYAHPRISPDGQNILWLEWNHPDMPWDQTKLCIAEFDALGDIAHKDRLGQPNESIFQPEWSPNNKVFFVSDRDQIWNIYQYDHTTVSAVHTSERECGLPLWQFGMTTWGFLSDEQIIVTSCQGANWQIETVSLSMNRESLSTKKTERLCDHQALSAYNHFSGLATDPLKKTAAVIAAGASVQPALCTISNKEIEIVAESASLGLSYNDIATPTEIKFHTTENDEAYGYFYPPTNRSYEAPTEEKPPLIVLCHGGPTASTTATFNLKVQFWTSRGFAVADINYRGSTGYGRAYREKLNGKWGIYDVDDACAAVAHLVEQAMVDPDRLIIRGGSAGGYTVLSALCFRDVFTAGCSLYGIGDLSALANDTHKFESRYMDSLIAPVGRSDIYEARSPIRHIDGFDCPTIFFQGLKDKVVPPNQAESMADALKKKQIPVALITYTDEGHGFRNSKNVFHAFNAELAFYGNVFGFNTDSTVHDLEIHNLESD